MKSVCIGNLTLEFLSQEDAEDLSSLCRPLFREAYNYVSDRVVEDFLETHLNPESIREQMAAGTEFAYVYDGGKRVGLIGYAMGGTEMYLSKLYFFDGCRGKGYGSACLEFIEAKAGECGAERIYLETNILNSGGIRFYERHGFRSTGTVVEMRVRMGKVLRSSHAC